MNPRLALPVIVSLLLLLLPVGCGEDDPAASDPTTSSAPQPVPVPLAAHVVPPDGLPGFTSDAAAERQDLATFATEHDKTVAELRRTGMVAGASLMFEPATKVKGFGLSVAAEFATEEQAVAEANRLFAANSEPEDGMTVAPLAVPGIPGAQAVTLEGEDGGTPFYGVEIVFADGLVTHEVFVVGEKPAVVVPDLVAAATDLYEQVAGRPLAG